MVALMPDTNYPAYKLIKTVVYKHHAFILNPPLTQKDSSQTWIVQQAATIKVPKIRAALSNIIQSKPIPF